MIDLADNALTTVEALKIELEIDADDSSQDDHLRMLINIVSASIESELFRELGRATLTELVQGFGRQRISVQRYPIQSVDSVLVNGVEVTDYRSLGGNTGQLYRKGGFPLCAQPYRAAGPATVGGMPNAGPPLYEFTSDIDPGTADYNVEVTYTGGYVLPKDATVDSPRTLPWDIEGACLRLCIDMHRRDPGVKTDQAAGGTRLETDPALLAAELRKLRRYRRWA